jgi:hypothetical protein
LEVYECISAWINWESSRMGSQTTEATSVHFYWSTECIGSSSSKMKKKKKIGIVAAFWTKKKKKLNKVVRKFEKT